MSCLLKDITIREANHPLTLPLTFSWDESAELVSTILLGRIDGKKFSDISKINPLNCRFNEFKIA